MDASIPGRYGFRRRSEQREVALQAIWRCSARLVEAEVDGAPETEAVHCGITWSDIPPGLDPAEGELDEARASRKRDQVTSLAGNVLEMMADGARVVEFGAGSGHLGILLAYLRPDAQVVLVETKEYSVPVARQRVADLGLRNCSVFHGTLEAFADSGEPFDLAVGLHACGLLTDALLSLAIRRGAAVCVTPCCYGQVAATKEDHCRGEGTAARRAPLSAALVAALDADGCQDGYAWCAKAADFTPGRGGAFDPASPGFLTALRCMRTVDADRLWWARERGYTGSLGLLSPLGCSPKCCVIRLRPPGEPRPGEH